MQKIPARALLLRLHEEDINALVTANLVCVHGYVIASVSACAAVDALIGDSVGPAPPTAAEEKGYQE